MAYRKKSYRAAPRRKSGYSAAPKRRKSTKRAAPRAQVIKIQFSHVPQSPVGAMPNMYDPSSLPSPKGKQSKL